jgi:hypothetical protein
MGPRRVIGAILATAFLVVGPATPSASAVATLATRCSADDFNGDPRLGPRELPNWGSVGLEVRTYDRFGGLTPEQFIATYWDDTANGGQGGWRFPPANGFLIGPDGQPVHTVMNVRVGDTVDRYGSEFGAFLAPVGSPYSQRALPPQSLDNTTNPGGCNYSAYRVVRAFNVDGGPIAPAFGQPGKGLQYMLVGPLVAGAPERLNVLRWLIDNGFLQRCVLVASRPFAC